MANASHRKRPVKQHDLRGASLDRIAEDIYKRLNEAEPPFSSALLQLGGIIALAIHREAQHARKLR